MPSDQAPENSEPSIGANAVRTHAAISVVRSPYQSNAVGTRVLAVGAASRQRFAGVIQRVNLPRGEGLLSFYLHSHHPGFFILLCDDDGGVGHCCFIKLVSDSQTDKQESLNSYSCTNAVVLQLVDPVHPFQIGIRDGWVC